MPLTVVLQVCDTAVPRGTTADRAARILRLLADEVVSQIPQLEDGTSVRVSKQNGLVLGVATYTVD